MASVTARLSVKLTDGDFLTVEISRSSDDTDEVISPLVTLTFNDLNNVLRNPELMNSILDTAYGTRQYYESLAYKKGVLKS